MTALADLSAAEASEAFRTGRLSPPELLPGVSG